MDSEHSERQFSSATIDGLDIKSTMTSRDEKKHKKNKVKPSAVPSKRKKRIVYFFFFIALLAAIGSAVFFYIQYSQLKPKVDDPSLAIDAQSKQIKENVAKLILIDPGEELSLITIKDIDSVRKDNAEFYKNAQNGDFILVSAKRAIIYNDKKNIIINVAPVFQSTPTPVIPTNTPAPVITPTTKNRF